MDNLKRQAERLRRALEQSRLEEPLRTHKNINRALETTQNVLRHFTVLNEVEQVLNQEPSRLEDVTDAMNKLEFCRAFFTSQMAYSEPGFTSTVDPVLHRINVLVCSAVTKAEKFSHNLRALSRLSRVISFNKKLNDMGLKSMGLDFMDFKIHDWMSKMEMTVKSGYSGERRLCNEVLSGIEEPLLDDCFKEITSESLGYLLSILSDDILKKGDKSPHFLFPLIDVFMLMRRLMPEMEAMFASKTAILDPMKTLMKEVAETAVEICLTSDEVTKNKWSRRWNEGVHPMSHYVIAYIKKIFKYKESLERILLEYGPKDHKRPSIAEMVSALESNLLDMSKEYTEQGQSYLFMMNKATSMHEFEVAQELLELGCKSIQTNAVQENAELYMKASWEKVVDTILSQDLVPSSQGANNPAITASKLFVKNRLKAFNKKFKKQYHKQRKWTVSDPELRGSLQHSVTEFVVPAYKAFLEQFGPIIQTSKSQCSMKYTPEDVEKKIRKNLFAEGEV